MKIYTGDDNYENPIDHDLDISDEIRAICTEGSVCQLETIFSSLQPIVLTRYLNRTNKSAADYFDP